MRKNNHSVRAARISNRGRCLLIKDIFALVCDYAGNVDLNKCY